MPPMANQTPRGRGSFRSRFQLNPAFAQAHGIATTNSTTKSTAQVTETETETRAAVSGKHDNENEKTVTEGNPPTSQRQQQQHHELPISPSPVQNSPQSNATTTKPAGLDQIERAIGRARTSGKLQVSDSGLQSPLPKILFEFPSLADTVDMCLDTNPNKLKPWESHVAETLVLIDFSDNEGLTKFPTLPIIDSTDSPHTSDNSLERYRSVQIFRARRCNLNAFSITPTLQENWSQLLTLDLSGNNLSGEFALLHLPKTIRELDLSGNQLTSLKSSTDYPSSSISLPQLVSLDISHNKISSTGISPVMHLPSLQRINVGQNQIFNLSFILKSISSSEKSLTTLYAPKSLLSDLDGQQPIDLTNFLALLSVDLSENSLCRVPMIPSSLQRLNVNENDIHTMAGMLQEDTRTSQLVVLQMQRNKLKTLDPEILVKLTQLNRLDLQFNALSSLPLELGDLTNLQQMFLEGNDLNGMRSAGIRGGLNDTKAILMRLRARKTTNHSHHQDGGDETVASVGSGGSGRSKKSAGSSSNNNNKASNNADVGGLLSSLLVGIKVLNYEGKHAHMLPYKLMEELKTSPPDVVQNIERFNVAKNQLHTVESDWFTLLPQLTIFEAQDNRLNSLPANIRELALTQIVLSRNSLTSHSVQWSILVTSSKTNILTDTLQTLDLSSNNLDTFAPEFLRHFKSLRNLNLSRNRILSLKTVVDAPYPPLCPCLEHLNLSENRVEDLGGDEFPLLLKIGCPKLHSLRLDNNELVMIPMTLGLLEDLKSLDLRGNPQRMIRYDVLDKSTSDVLQYMRNRMTAKTKEKVRLKMEELCNASMHSSNSSLEMVAVAPAPAPAPAPSPSMTAPTKKEESVVASPPGSPTKPGGTTRQPNYMSPLKRDARPRSSSSPSAKNTPPAKGRLTTPRKPASSTPSKLSVSSPPGSPQGRNTSRIATPKTRQGLSPVALSGNTPKRNSAIKSRQGLSPVALSGNSPRRNSAFNNNNKGNGKDKGNMMTSPLLEELEKSIEELAAEFDRPGLSEPKRYAIKKKLAMERSKRLREERRLKQERAHSGIY